VLSVFAQQSSPAGSAATVPPLVNFSGELTSAAGGPATGMVGITFLLYKDSQGGAPLWMETQNVQPDKNGHYSVMLGSTSSHGLPADIFAAGQARWLGVQAEGQSEQPRVSLLSVPYALKAADAQTVGGLPPSAFVLATAPAASDSPAPSSAATAQPAITPALAGSGTLDFIPLWTPNGTTLGNSILFQNGSLNLGIGTQTPAAKLDVSGSARVRGTLLLPATGTATAGGGKNSQPLNLAASAYNSGTATAVNQTFSWLAEPAGNNTASASGTLNLLFGVGTSTPTETGLHVGSGGLFTFAAGQTFPGTGTITGVTAGTGLAGGGTTGNVPLSMLKSCAVNQVLQWNGSAWVCGSVGTGNGTITGVTAGTYLTGGGASGNVTLNLDVSKVPQLTSANHFTANQSVTGNLSATGSISAGTLSGNGAAVTGVNAALLNSIPSSSFALVTGSNTFPANQFFNGNGQQMIVGDPGCGSGYLAIGFGALSGCHNYALAGDGANTYINRPAGGSIFFSENGSAEMTIAPGGAVSITSSQVVGFAPALYATSQSESYDGMKSIGGGGASYDVTGGRGLLAEGGTETNTERSKGGDAVEALGGGGYYGGVGVLAGGGNGSSYGNDGIDADGGSGPSGNGYSGFFSQGDVNVNANLLVAGVIVAGIKDFRIDHPLDPANKYLYHASVESSEMMNIYTGNVTLDGSGAASVDLPEWFEALNGDYRYQLTAIGAAAPNLHIAQKVANHQFSIAGGAPGMEVSWLVTGVRHDAFAQANPLVAEVEKPANERGFYLHPALYGQPEEKQIEWGRFPAKMRRLKEKRIAPSKLASVKK
jgi:hypothetical protein